MVTQAQIDEAQRARVVQATHEALKKLCREVERVATGYDPCSGKYDSQLSETIGRLHEALHEAREVADEAECLLPE